KINHRGILSGLASMSGMKEKEGSLFVAIDKLDKIGEGKVREELLARGFNSGHINNVFSVLDFNGSTNEKIEFLKQTFAGNDAVIKSVGDLEEVFAILKSYGASIDHVELDIALARGLSYYTGCIFEVKVNNVAIGSVTGGGRYDNLTSVFDSKEKSSGTGISFGVDRIFDAMEELKLFPDETLISSQVLICHLDAECREYGLRVLGSLRKKGISSEIYPDLAKPQKQLDYANKKKIAYAIIVGSEEMKSGLLTFKNMKTGDQQMLSLENILAAFT
ncbi:MAG TPA: HisS family protein, partial [Cyclobacteriaceae bacterium]|nr:HisS family protein [Cyclobacteriaceae bacterium]